MFPSDYISVLFVSIALILGERTICVAKSDVFVYSTYSFLKILLFSSKRQ